MSQGTGRDAPAHTQLRSALGRVRGTGAARSGAQHWWTQRLTSLALLPLTVWFTLSLAGSAGLTHAEALAWIGSPFNAVLLLALIGLTMHHTAAGLQVIIEDYVRAPWARTGGILAVRALAWLLGIAAALAVLRIAV